MDQSIIPESAITTPTGTGDIYLNGNPFKTYDDQAVIEIDFRNLPDYESDVTLSSIDLNPGDDDSNIKTFQIWYQPYGGNGLVPFNPTGQTTPKVSSNAISVINLKKSLT